MLNYCLKICTIGTILIFLNIYTASAQDETGKDTTTNSSQRGSTGTVLDEFAQPLGGVYITTGDGKLIGTTKDDGLYSLSEVEVGQKLIFNRRDYNLKTVVVKDKTALTTRLENSYLKDPEKIGVLYNEKNTKEIVGSVSSVYTRQIETTPTSLYLNALTGRIAGFYTQEISGFRSARTAPITYNDLAGSLPSNNTKYSSTNSDNSEISFNLRGQSPVVLIDGVQRDIYSLDPESIESITVLKDALSTLLLGQKSSRGVLQVTTKKGIAGPPRISFTAETGLQSPLKTPNPLSAYQYAYLYNEALLNEGKPTAFSASDFDAYRNGTSPYLFPDVNWYNTILKKSAPITKYNLNVSGGLKNARYSISLSYLNQQGLFKTSDAYNYNTNLGLSRYLINSSVDVDVSKNFTVGLQLFGRIQDGTQPGALDPTNGNLGTNQVLSLLYATPNNAYPVYNPDGSYGGSQIYNRNLYQQTAGAGYYLDNNRDLMANLDLKYKFDQWLPGLYTKIKANVSSTSSSLISRNIEQPVYDLSLNPTGNLVYSRQGYIADQANSFNMTSTVQFFYVQAALGYDARIGDHKFGAMLFADQQRATFQFDLPQTFTNLAATANYSYKQKYFMEAAIDDGGFDRLRPGHQYGLFYAGGIGWNISEESFLKDHVKWINLLKVRATYGKTGNSNENSLGYFSWRSSFGQDGSNSYPNPDYSSSTLVIAEQMLANTNATWEKAHKLNLGLDMAFLQSHLNVVADYYYDVYYDLLQQRGATNQLMGFTYPNENIGKNLYTGQELTVTYKNNIGSFNYFITANASRMKTEVLYMDELKQAYSWNEHTGKPVGQTFGYLADGLIQTQEEADKAPLLAGTKVYPGDVKLVDLNGDGKIDQFDQTAIGNTKPIIYYGTTFGFSFKGFDCSILLQGVKNRTYQQMDYSFGADGKSQGYDYLIGRWTPENAATATYPRLTLGFNANNTPYLNTSSYWTRSGEYFRIKNVDIGYTFPLKNNKLKLSGIRIFVNAQNLFTSTEYSRLDPEVYSSTVYPIQRIINAGINIKL